MSKITYEFNSVVCLDCDAVVNAANSSLAAGGGVCGAIFDAAGYEELTKECRKYNGCLTGEAVVTSGCRLKAKYIIHTVGPVYRRQGDEGALLAACYRNSLDVAMQNGVHSIGFPCISTGIFGFPLREASEIAVATAKRWIADHADYNTDIVFCCFRAEEYKIYEEILSR